MSPEEITHLWQLSMDDAEGMRLGFTTQQHYFAALVAAAEREACVRKTEEFARKWWSIHCDTNKCLAITSQAHNDFCALQAAIRARGATK